LIFIATFLSCVESLLYSNIQMIYHHYKTIKMIYLRSIFLVLLTTSITVSSLNSQKTYFSADNKFTSLLDTKLLKTGEIVLLERYRFCDLTRVKLLHPNGDTEIIWSDGKAEFFSFLEMPDNNWVLVLISDPTDDVPVPHNIVTIAFENGVHTIFNSDDDQTSIDLTGISSAAVINDNELVLYGNKDVHFTDFTLSSITTVNLFNPLSIMRSPLPDSSFLYYKYSAEDAIRATQDSFATNEVIAFNLGPAFRDIRYLGNYTIIIDESEISALFGIFAFFYIEQDKTIYNFRQHGQNLTYQTISEDSIVTFNKLFLDTNESFKKDSIQFDLKETGILTGYHWDSNFVGVSTEFTPLPKDTYKDPYRGHHYLLDYNLQGKEIERQSVDLSIDHIEYTTDPDSITPSSGYIDVYMNITLTNNSDETIDELYLYSTVFEGINCAHNAIKADLEDVIILPNESIILEAKYEELDIGYVYPDYDLCVYTIAGNNKSDLNFNDNIYCLQITDPLSTDDKKDINQVSISPNPVSDQVQLECESPTVYHVYSMHGELVAVWNLNKNKEIFDPSFLNRGNYILVDQKSRTRSIFTKI